MTNINISDVLIHINENLNIQQKSELEEAMRNIDGVIAPRFNNEKKHLFFIAFNPSRTNNMFLLEKVKSFGFNAQIIGI